MKRVRLDYLGKGEKAEAVNLPLSKSMAARALILDYVRGEEGERELPDCADTRELSAAIATLKSYIPNLPEYMNKVDSDDEIEPIYIEEELDLGSGGTSLRFFLALVASIPGLKTKVTCSEQLKVRPLMPLINVLREFGAEIMCTEKEGYAPLEIKGGKLKGGKAELPSTITSQYLSAMILVESLWKNKLQAEVMDELQVSKPYLQMTRRMAAQPGRVEIEPDWSAAAFFYEIALIAEDMEIEISELKRPEESMQGDARCAEIFEALGVRTEYSETGGVKIKGDKDKIEGIRKSGRVMRFDMAQTPDLVPALAVSMAFVGIRFELTGTKTLRYKESDRISALVCELGKLGYQLEANDDSLIYKGGRVPEDTDISLSSWNDHRIAMALSGAAVKINGLAIESECVNKSFPNFFEEIKKLRN